MAQFLVCDDYGTGGIWGYVEAGSVQEVVDRYPTLIVHEAPPAWCTDEDLGNIRRFSGNPAWIAHLKKLQRT